jgi:hypothetical protein
MSDGEWGSREMGGVGEWRSGVIVLRFLSLPLSPSLFSSVLAKHPTPSEKEWVAV